ncbi:anhydro-N-acetylmuramic acid kinase [bacterium]|nr:anhydro-N-acetylmuramic acid kinase [bacterium]
MGNVYHAIGIMSGTSLDGLDIALSTYTYNTDHQWKYHILKTKTVPYDAKLKQQLQMATEMSGLELKLLENHWSIFVAHHINLFVKESQVSPDLIGNHGHTIFHQIDKKLTYQIANNSLIATHTNIPTIGDFRSADVALGGQGAPLVPIGDHLLFNHYDCCINLGGIANISYQNKDKSIAFDCCPFNIPLNLIANSIGLDFDSGGEIAATGVVHRPLLERLKAISFFYQSPPKSLGIEWIRNHFLPIIDEFEISNQDILATLVELYADIISRILLQNNLKQILITGGGAHHKHFIELLEQKSNLKIFKIDKETIDFKEAIIFGFLGVLRWRKENNTLPSVTGASRAHCSGGVYLP